MRFMGWGQECMDLVLKKGRAVDGLCLSVCLWGCLGGVARHEQDGPSRTVQSVGLAGPCHVFPDLHHLWSEERRISHDLRRCAGLLGSLKCIIIHGKLCKLKLPLKSIMYVTIWSLPPYSPLSPEVVFLFSFRTITTFIHVCSPLRRVPGLTHHSVECCRRWRWWKDGKNPPAHSGAECSNYLASLWCANFLSGHHNAQ